LPDESLSLGARRRTPKGSDGLNTTAKANQEVGHWVQNIGGHYFTAFYRPEVSMDIQNTLTRTVAVTAGIAAAGLAVGAAAMGACAIGALAIGALALRRVAIRGGRVEQLSVGQLTVDRLLVKDSVNRE
jgi:phage-related minor tail protein